jgi:trimeric autotransporter adhesin
MDREGNRRENVDTEPERLTMQNVSLSSCIGWAYRVQASEVSRKKGQQLKTKIYFLCSLMLWLSAFPLVASALAAAEHHGQVKFGGLPMPGATVTASQGDKKLVTVSDAQGVYSFPDLPEGVWTIEVEMLCFVPVKQEVTVGSEAAIPDWDLKLLPLDEIKAQAGPQAAQAVSVAINAPAAAPPPDTVPTRKSKKTPPPPANTPGGFQRTDVNASKSDAAAQSNAAATAAANDNTAANDDLSKKAADGLLINGTANNGASSPFATNPAFGNNRTGIRSLYNGSLGFRIDNSALDAQQFSTTGQQTPKPSYNQFTGLAQFGGPIRIPHVTQNGPFFFLAYQWLRNRTVATTPGTMPTVAERSGDFSQAATTVIDPMTGLAFPGNIIPQNRISPQALSLLNLYPLPNFSGRYNYQLPLVSPTHQDSMNSRLNKTLNRKNQVNGGFSFQSTRSATPNLLDFIDKTDSLGWVANANWHHNFTNRFWMTVGYSFSRQSTTLTPNFANKENISGEAGILGNNQQPQNWGPPSLNFLQSGIYSLSDGNQSVIHNETGAVSESTDWNHGRHRVTFGGDFKKQQFNTIGQQSPRGSFGFTGAAAGNDFAGFLLGVPDTSSIAYGNADKYLRTNVYDAFVQDDVRISPSLTINAGLRYDYWAPITELYGRLVNLDVVPGFSAAAPVVANTPVGPLTGDKYPDSLIHADKHGFEPILGLAWRPFPASSMVVRANYGLYYNTSAYLQIAQNMDQQAPLSKSFSVQNSPTDPLTLANGFNASPSSTATGFGIDPNFRVGYAQNWGASVQRDLPGALIMTATYLGIKGTRGTQEFYPNTYPIGAVNPCPTCLPGYTYMTSNGNSTREAGQMQVRRRLHNGITASVLYVYSKSIDDAGLGGKGLFVAQNWLDLRGERGLSPFDQRHQVTIQGQYTSGMGMRGGTLLSGWRGAVFKEWTVNSQIIVGSGSPLTPIYPGAVPGTGFTNTIRPDYTGASVYAAPPGLFLNPAAYAAPAPGQWGNAGRDSITGPMQFTMIASLGRVFRLTDKLNLEARVDSTNTLNHVTFQSYITQVTPQFGLPGPPNGMRTLLTTVRLRF